MVKRIAHTLLILMFVLSLSLAALFVHWMIFINEPLFKTNQPFAYNLESGHSLRDVVRDLQAKGMMAHPWYLLALAKLQNQAHHLKAGYYVFAPETTPRDFLRKLYQGDVFTYQVTLVEGWTLKEVLDKLHTQPYLKHTIDRDKPNWQNLTDALNLSQQSLEGQFFPDTYQLTVGVSDTDLLKASHKHLLARLQRLWPMRDKNVPYKTPYQALIAASMIEKESAVISERPLISGVIARRLKLGMPLQIDATLIYGLYQRFKSQTVLSKKDLRTDTPYNTYLRRGLPPTPIALVSDSALSAALHPAPGKALYFVAKGDGSHVFSETLKAHNAAVQRYLRNNAQEGQ